MVSRYCGHFGAACSWRDGSAQVSYHLVSTILKGLFTKSNKIFAANGSQWWGSKVNLTGGKKIQICHQMQFNSVLRFFLSRYYGGGEGRPGGGGSGGPRERWTFELGAVSTSQVTESFLCPLLIGFIGTDRTCLPHPLMWQTQLVCRSSRWSKFKVQVSILSVGRTSNYQSILKKCSILFEGKYIQG